MLSGLPLTVAHTQKSTASNWIFTTIAVAEKLAHGNTAFFRNVHHRTLITIRVTKQKKTTFSKWEPKNAFPHVTFKHSFRGS